MLSEYYDVLNALDTPLIAIVAFYLLTSFRKAINRHTETITILITKLNGMKGGKNV